MLQYISIYCLYCAQPLDQINLFQFQSQLDRSFSVIVKTCFNRMLQTLVPKGKGLPAYFYSP